MLDIDIEKFYDSIDRELLMRAVRKHTESKWIILYIERWLRAPLKKIDGGLEIKEEGIFQGNVISPLLANLFLHYAMDVWLKKQYPNNPYERYADDMLLHCGTEEEARELRKSVEQRLAACKLKLHPEKTKIVYCKDGLRKGEFTHEKFEFLGYEFRIRKTKSGKGKYISSFSPAISNKSAKTIRQTMRGWKLHLRSDKELGEIARKFNPILQGWMNYYGQYYKSAFYPILEHLNHTLTRWVMKKYKKLKTHKRRAAKWLGRISRQNPQLFVHWKWVKPLNG